jgi:Na+/proline symporter
MNLNMIDAAIVVIYMAVILTLGIAMERRAGKSMDSYFLGGRSIPWWLLGMSGSSTYFDITGTMWIVSTFYLLGVRGLWEHWFWCFPFAGFLFAYKGKWTYRSGVLTNMEWLIFRYGDDRAGHAARIITVVISLTLLILMLGYAGTGVGKFIEEFLSIDKSVAIPLLFAITGLYVLLGGFFSVVFSDFFQTILLSAAAIYISITAFLKIDINAFRETVGDDWFSIAPVWKLGVAPEQYSDAFGLLVMLWLFKGMIHLFTNGSTSPGAEFQRFRAARNESEASKIAFAWGLVFSLRWALVMAFTVFGLSILVNQGAAIDSERVLPMVINRVLPVGIKGLVIAGLIAAFMSTFDSTLNVAASYVVNDLVKPVWKKATSRQLMIVSYASTLVILLLGILISLRTDQIRDIWNPINFALGSALLIPGLVAPYWWRIGGWAHFSSGLITLIAAILVYYLTDWNALRYFPLLAGISATSCFAASYLFPPATEKTLMNFFGKIRPFGIWGPVRRMMVRAGKDPKRFQRDRYDIPVAIAATFFFIFLYLCAIDIVLHNWVRVSWLMVFMTGLGIYIYFFKWRMLKNDHPYEDNV